MVEIVALHVLLLQNQNLEVRERSMQVKYRENSNILAYFIGIRFLGSKKGNGTTFAFKFA